MVFRPSNTCHWLIRSVAILAIAVIHAPSVNAQVNGLGPSDPALFDTVINLPPDPDIDSVESIGGVIGQTIQLNVMDGGTVGQFFRANTGSEVNISGGDVEGNFFSSSGSEVNISGGNIGGSSGAFSGSVVNISGGNVGGSFIAFLGSEINISGGSIGRGFDGRSGSDIELLGGEFKLNGNTFTNRSITLGGGDVFTGTLMDGSAFIFSSNSSDRIIGVTLTPTSLPAIDTEPILVDTSLPSRSSGLRAGQTLTLTEGGELGVNFEAVHATLNIEGGVLGSTASTAQSVVNISGGSVGRFFVADSNSEVNITGGNVGSDFRADKGSVVNISGGSVGNDFRANTNSQVNISGGSVGDDLVAVFDSQVNISGGDVGSGLRVAFGGVVNISGGTVGQRLEVDNDGVVNISGGSVDSLIANKNGQINISSGNVGAFTAFRDSQVNINGGILEGGYFARSGSEVNLYGTEFLINGIRLQNLTVGEAFVITERNVVLSGLWRDGTSFEFELNSGFVSGEDLFDFGSKITVTLVPEPGSMLLGMLSASALFMQRRV